jgi:cobalt/nickel transport system permease protein
MHIASGMLSPPVWGTMAAVSGAALAGALVAARREVDERRVPLMGVMGAFVFAAQMVNFSVPLVPGTSGHLGGGFLLGILLGPWLGMIAMASILVVQALVFQDGGVEALGANVFAMGVLPCLLGSLVRGLWQGPRRRLAYGATFAGALLGVAAGAALVIGLLAWSHKIPAAVTFGQAMTVMLSIHGVIGVVEGVVSVAVVRYVVAARPEAVWGEAVLVPGKGVSA